MGQRLSRLFRSQSPQAQPALLKLPAELILCIAAQLSSSPESVVALSLTCKHLRTILANDVVKVQAKCRGRLLALVEKDLGDRLFYCSVCCQLHAFSPWWDPTNGEHLAFQSARHNRFYCHAQQVFNLNAAQSLYHVFGRLVMNRHFYGAPKGLPLDTLAKPVWARSWGGGPLCRQTPSARIVRDELFLRVTHTLEGRASELSATPTLLKPS
ncbi:hypothetical protein C8A03DRAFT_18117 [Achaetomium macrosporum]|uniref:F-box domain-containing protein n=1 Tax=Achaetomium macrosporum TaxID=79813 RepID=A0AAN7H947_9PEZI|nr:hypothetical protein C8A03DRAFT_18117 [Achaetomium macrosporum]